MISFHDLMQMAGLAPRDVQSRYADMIARALAMHSKISLAHSETGTGKSLGYMMTALSMFIDNPKARFVIATNSHALMAQLYDKEAKTVAKAAAAAGGPIPSVSRLLGRANFVSRERLSIAVMGVTTRPHEESILLALQDWTQTIAEFIDEFGELPLGLSPADICMTPENSSDDFSDRQRLAADADIVVTSHAMLITDMMSGHKIFGARDDRPLYLIVDEADQLVGMLQQMQQRRLNLVEFRHKLAPHLSAKKMAPIEDAIGEARAKLAGRSYAWDGDISTMATAIISAVEKMIRQIKDESARREILDDLAQWRRFGVGQKVGLGVSMIRQEPAVVAINPFYSRYFAEFVARNWKSCVLTSGTLSITHDVTKGTQWLKTDLGIDENSIGLQELFSPEHFGTVALRLAGASFPPVFVKQIGDDEVGDIVELSHSWIGSVAKVITQTKGDRLVVLTASHEESRLLVAALRQASETRALHHHAKNEKLRIALNSFSTNGGVLITAAGHVGLDIRHADGSVGFDHLFITRIAYAKPNKDELLAIDAYYREQKKRFGMLKILTRNQYMRSQNDAIRTCRQAFGRGLRSESDRIAITILDPRFPLSHDVSSKYAPLRNVIPIRFYESYRNCEVIGSIDVSAAETNHPEEEMIF